MAMSDTETLVQYVLSLWIEVWREAVKQREIDAARERMQRMKNAQCERALKAFVMSDAQALFHYCFSTWHDDVKDLVKQREFEEARKRMQQTNNEQYERALKSMAMSDSETLVQYV